MTDEHNFRTISSYRNHLLSKYPKESVDVWGDNVFVETPNIDSLANDGVLFTNFYSPLPQCTPSRASFMTGMYPNATGASSNHQPMNEDQTTWAEILQQNGYYTGYVGKWHLDGESIPGFDAPKGRNFGFNQNIDTIEDIGNALMNWKMVKSRFTMISSIAKKILVSKI